MSRLRTNRVCFTLNNPDQEEIDQIQKWFEEDNNGLKFGICGQEIGESGTPHLQGFLHSKEDRKKCGINFWKNLLPGGKRAHFEGAKGSDEDNEKYCSKEGVFITCGQAEQHSSEWAKVFETAKTDLEAALAINPEISIKYYNQLKAINQDHSAGVMDAKLDVLRDWQSCVLQKLLGQSDRKVLFVVDEVGGKGKSALAKHLLTNYRSWACQGELLFKKKTSLLQLKNLVFAATVHGGVA
jgi:hypothetical protein